MCLLQVYIYLLISWTGKGLLEPEHNNYTQACQIDAFVVTLAKLKFIMQNPINWWLHAWMPGTVRVCVCVGGHSVLYVAQTLNADLPLLDFLILGFLPFLSVSQYKNFTPLWFLPCFVSALPSPRITLQQFHASWPQLSIHRLPLPLFPLGHCTKTALGLVPETGAHMPPNL